MQAETHDTKKLMCEVIIIFDVNHNIASNTHLNVMEKMFNVQCILLYLYINYNS